MTISVSAARGAAFARGLARACGLAPCLVLGAGVSAGVAQAAQPPHVIYTFSSAGTEGYDPPGSMIMDSADDLFGVTLAGGDNGDGAVFKLIHPAGSIHGWRYKRLYSFSGGADGKLPNDGLAMDAAGDLIGITTSGGAANDGTIFMLTPSSSDPTGYTKTTLHSFSGADGASPGYALTPDAAGNYYGTTASGGSANNGTIFKLAPPAATGLGWTLTTLHAFVGADQAATPISGLTFDKEGRMYGTTYAGKGTVYQFAPDKKGGGTLSVIYAFQGLNDGQTPFDGVSFTASGALVGAAFFGGVDTYGTVYQLTPVGKAWHETTLGYFNGKTCGAPSGKVLVAPNGHLFGVASGPSCVYEVTPRASGSGYQIDQVYGMADTSANGALVADKKGNLFGADEQGGNVGGELYVLPAAEKH